MNLTWLLKALRTCPWAAFWTTAYRRTQYVFWGLMMLAMTSVSLSWGMVSYAPVTSTCVSGGEETDSGHAETQTSPLPSGPGLAASPALSLTPTPPDPKGRAGCVLSEPQDRRPLAQDWGVRHRGLVAEPVRFLL